MNNSKSGGLVVDKEGDDEKTGGGWFSFDYKKYGSAIVIVVLVVIIASVVYCKEGFTSPDGVVASKESRLGVRSDAHVDRTWNLIELEKSVALINRKAGN